MKLANALSERSDIQKKLAQLQPRLNNNARVQEGDTPSEDPVELMQLVDELYARLEELIARINMTNSKTVADGLTLTEWLAKRDCLKQKIGMLRSFLDSASARTDRYSNTEIRVRSTVNVRETQKRLDDMSGELRAIDERIQELNWLTELL